MKILAFLVLAATMPFAATAQDDIQRRTANAGNVVLEDVPEIPESISRALSRYQNVRSASLLDWTADSAGLLIATRFADLRQIHRVQQPLGARHQLTWFDEPVGSVARRPGSEEILFLMDRGGSEFDQIFLFVPGEAPRMLSDGESRNGAPEWSDDGRLLAFQSTRRNGRSNDVWIHDLEAGGEPRLLLESPDGSWWGPIDFSADGSRLLVLQYVSANDSRIHVVDVASGERRRIVGGGEHPGRNFPYAFDAQGTGIFYGSDADSEFVELHHKPLAEGSESRSITADIPWSVGGLELAGTGDRAAFVVNAGGFSEVYALDPRTFETSRIESVPPGVVGGAAFSPDGQRLALTVNNARSPSDVWVLDWDDMDIERWTHSETGGLDSDGFVMPELIHYPTFDEVDGEARRIPAFVYRPDGDGPHPVVIQIHGGPEGQSRPTFSSTYQLWIDRLGAAVIRPNVRGSSGYGKSWLRLDNGFRREDSVRDIGALLDWIAEQPDLDETRVAVYGGSYGGYMVLASAVHYSDRLKAAVDVVGISSFVTFLENTEDYRRDLRRVEYGDERDPEMRAHLEAISPLNNVEKIDVPMFVIQGENDPRVPVTEAEQIVAALREQGSPVWYMNALNEGHGYRRKENRDLYSEAVVLFLETYLLD
ncbi:MAG: S9 family peptidase [Wenzhouxiangellaceae bacterium]|nr:S9 family peptidase [Wenzhouxiangellaceae bacterium]